MKKTTMIAVVVSVLMIGVILFGVAQTRSGDKAPTYNKLLTDTQKIELLQRLYHKAPDFNHIAIGAYEDGFSEGDLLRDGYVPYEENYKQEDVYFLHGSAHGVSVRVHIKQTDTALTANEKLIEEFNQKYRCFVWRNLYSRWEYDCNQNGRIFEREETACHYLFVFGYSRWREGISLCTN